MTSTAPSNAVNVATGALATSSTKYGDSAGPDKAIDGNTTPTWSGSIFSTRDDDTASKLMIDFQASI
eukprot:tig00021366_g20842.t1